MPEFRVGQKVECVDAGGALPAIRVGEKYLISALEAGYVGIIRPGERHTRYYRTWRFRHYCPTQERKGRDA